MKTQNTNSQKGFAVPVAIIIASIIIAGSMFWSTRNNSESQASRQPHSTRAQANTDFRLPNELDHTRGNNEAKVTIIEFSDFQCPFCSRLHPTLDKIVKENEEVRWVYRHFPLSIHSKALESAVASECIAELGGNDAFWNFTDTVFANQNRVGDKLYEEIAGNLNIELEAFRTCTKNKDVTEKVRTDLNEVIAIGGRGTPFSVIVNTSGELTSFSGALPYEQIKSLIDQALVN